MRKNSAGVVLVAISVMTFALGIPAASATTWNAGPDIVWSYSGFGTYCLTAQAQYLEPGYLVSWDGVATTGQFANPCPGYPPGSASGPLITADAVTWKKSGTTWVKCGDYVLGSNSSSVTALNTPGTGICAATGLPAYVVDYAATDFNGGHSGWTAVST